LKGLLFLLIKIIEIAVKVLYEGPDCGVDDSDFDFGPGHLRFAPLLADDLLKLSVDCLLCDDRHQDRIERENGRLETGFQVLVMSVPSCE